jgi:broad specificity phosphatase PhoE
MKFSPLARMFLALVVSTTVFATSHYAEESKAVNSPGLKNAVILVIRHAEKPESGDGLSPAGEARARAYVNYFHNYTVDSKPLRLNYLFSSADSKKSRRPRLTLEPLGKTLGLKIDSRFKDEQFLELTHEIQSRPPGNNILICWHHGEIPHLLHALGADPEKLIPNVKWPGDEFGWVIQLRYDEKGHLFESRRINEDLPPENADKHALNAP